MDFFVIQTEVKERTPPGTEHPQRSQFELELHPLCSEGKTL